MSVRWVKPCIIESPPEIESPPTIEMVGYVVAVAMRLGDAEYLSLSF